MWWAKVGRVAHARTGLEDATGLGFNARVRTRFRLVLVGLKMIFNGFSWGWGDGNKYTGLVEVWLSFETILTFTGGLPGKSEMLVSFRVCQPVTL